MLNLRKHNYKNIFLPFTLTGLLLTQLGVGANQSPGQQNDEKSARAQSLRDMRQCVQNTSVSSLGGNAKKIELLSRPLMRYTDPPRGTLDATLWLYTSDRLPLALQKVESRKGLWITGITSLTNDLIETRWSKERTFRTQTPGLSFRGFSSDSNPATTNAGRLRQMKELSRRFSATITNSSRGSGPQEMRLLPQPLYRYSASDFGVADAAIFALASTGTNPNAVVVIQLRSADKARPRWSYAVARLTVAELSVRLDGKEVWKAPYIAQRPVISAIYGSAALRKEK